MLRRRYQLPLTMAAGVLALDQLTKLVVLLTMPLGDRITVIPGFFNLVHVANRGAAFGFLNRSDTTWQVLFFSMIALVAMGILAVLAHRSEDDRTWYLASLGAIFGGAAGNLVDRLRLGYVVDFADMYLGGYHWPAFNVADTAITLGATIVILCVWVRERHASHAH